jgi:hypothetical protein
MTLSQAASTASGAPFTAKKYLLPRRCGRHHLAGRIEGVFVHDWAVLQQRRAPEPGAETGAQQC